MKIKEKNYSNVKTFNYVCFQKTLTLTLHRNKSLRKNCRLYLETRLITDINGNKNLTITFKIVVANFNHYFPLKLLLT